jgi:hypothetical protein
MSCWSHNNVMNRFGQRRFLSATEGETKHKVQVTLAGSITGSTIDGTDSTAASAPHLDDDRHAARQHDLAQADAPAVAIRGQAELGGRHQTVILQGEALTDDHLAAAAAA